MAVARISWWIYLARCADGSLYCGVTTDVARRIVEHNDSPRAARYTRSRRPVILVWCRRCRTRSSALKRECSLKRLSRREKEDLVSAMIGQ